MPALASTLAAVASSRLRLEEQEDAFAQAFVPAVAAMDEADRAYRRAIETTLPRDVAAAMLSAMASFRERVHAIREQTRREIGELYRRFNRTYGAFDPLDAYLPPTNGLSHADATRVATFSDAARAHVDALRAQVNETVAQRLAPAQIDALVAAKRRRGEAFETALKRALERAVESHPAITAGEIDKTRYGLVQLADGWY